MAKTPISIIILTYNEEPNINICLDSVKDFSDEIFIVDSYSNDKTLEISNKYTQKIYQNPWTHYAGQRRWALSNLPITNDWIIFLDADEQLTEPLKNEIHNIIKKELQCPKLGGYYVPRRFYFLGKAIRWGSLKGGSKELRLCNRHYLTIAERAGHEVYISRRPVGYLKEYMIHEDKKPLSAWIERHNRYSSSQAQYLWSVMQGRVGFVESSETKAIDRFLFWKEKFRRTVWHKLPIGFRPLMFFFVNYFLRLGFLDGFTGFIYHFLHDYWFLLLVDAKLLELRSKSLDQSCHHQL